MVRDNQIQCYKYKGTNEKMNAIMDGETVYIVNGPRGRRPVIAESRTEALNKYKGIQTREDKEVA